MKKRFVVALACILCSYSIQTARIASHEVRRLIGEYPNANPATKQAIIERLRIARFNDKANQLELATVKDELLAMTKHLQHLNHLKDFKQMTRSNKLAMITAWQTFNQLQIMPQNSLLLLNLILLQQKKHHAL